MESGALLAYAMNGQTLPPRHGYPLRLVLGYAANFIHEVRVKLRCVRYIRVCPE